MYYWYHITEKEGKAVHLGYAEKCSLVGLTQQVIHGPFDPSSSPPVGVLDVVGKDRRYRMNHGCFECKWFFLKMYILAWNYGGLFYQ